MSRPSPDTRLADIDRGALDAVRDMAARIWPVSYAEVISPAQMDYMLEQMYSPEALRRDVDERGVRYRWILGPQDRVGFLAFGPSQPGERVPLHKCYLLPESQGRGHGSRALEWLVAELADEGGSGIELRVNRHNARAIVFYRRNGFSVVDEDCLDIGGGFAMDDFVMVRPLP